jgi:hypothetical protein
LLAISFSRTWIRSAAFRLSTYTVARPMGVSDEI